ncbi:Obg-like ATPase 1 [Liparis tanakae]|uniref:Obg-like ATPase 1 n=1 Tax=Liparis tanakae TaxID=230148 RepID=A0A4Z2GMX9_9TELE|nr:Obg-like ATPase 1 [Liparis tanakae]
MWQLWSPFLRRLAPAGPSRSASWQFGQSHVARPEYRRDDLEELLIPELPPEIMALAAEASVEVWRVPAGFWTSSHDPGLVWTSHHEDAPFVTSPEIVEWKPDLYHDSYGCAIPTRGIEFARQFSKRKSTFLNVLTKSQAVAENVPFCTIDPNESRVPIPDERYDFLCQFHKPPRISSNNDYCALEADPVD